MSDVNSEVNIMYIKIKIIKKYDKNGWMIYLWL